MSKLVVDPPRLRDFTCERCEYDFEAMVGRHEAGLCPKCRDFEWVVRDDAVQDKKESEWQHKNLW